MSDTTQSMSLVTMIVARHNRDFFDAQPAVECHVASTLRVAAWLLEKLADGYVVGIVDEKWILLHTPLDRYTITSVEFIGRTEDINALRCALMLSLLSTRSESGSGSVLGDAEVLLKIMQGNAAYFDGIVFTRPIDIFSLWTLFYSDLLR